MEIFFSEGFSSRDSPAVVSLRCNYFSVANFGMKTMSMQQIWLQTRSLAPSGRLKRKEGMRPQNLMFFSVRHVSACKNMKKHVAHRQTVRVGSYGFTGIKNSKNWTIHTACTCTFLVWNAIHLTQNQFNFSR